MNLAALNKRLSLVVAALGVILVLAVACSPAGSNATSQPGQGNNAPGQPTVSTTTSVSFSKSVLPILEANCTQCHGPSRQSSNLMLNSYTNVMAGGLGGLVVVPGDAQKSELVQLISSGSMPRGGSKLQENEIQTITDWINAGAADN